MTENIFIENFKVFQSPVFEPIHLTEDDNGEAWFIGSEICEVLGIEETDDVYNTLDGDEKKVVSFSDVPSLEGEKYLLVSEPGMYRLVFSSRSENAKAFRKWLVKTILPAISTDGGCVFPVRQNA